MKTICKPEIIHNSGAVMPYNVQLWYSTDGGKTFAYTGNGKFLGTLDAAIAYAAETAPPDDDPMANRRGLKGVNMEQITLYQVSTSPVLVVNDKGYRTWTLDASEGQVFDKGTFELPKGYSYGTNGMEKKAIFDNYNYQVTLGNYGHNVPALYDNYGNRVALLKRVK